MLCSSLSCLLVGLTFCPHWGAPWFFGAQLRPQLIEGPHVAFQTKLPLSLCTGHSAAVPAEAIAAFRTEREAVVCLARVVAAAPRGPDEHPYSQHHCRCRWGTSDNTFPSVLSGSAVGPRCVSWVETNRVRGARDADHGTAWAGRALCSQLSAGAGKQPDRARPLLS